MYTRAYAYTRKEEIESLSDLQSTENTSNTERARVHVPAFSGKKNYTKSEFELWVA